MVGFTQPEASHVMANHEQSTNMQAAPAEEKKHVVSAAGQHGMQGHGTLFPAVAAHLGVPPEAIQALASLAMAIAPGASEGSTNMQSIASLTASLQEIIGRIQSQQAVHPPVTAPQSHCPPEANMPSPPTPAAVMPKPETAVAVTAPQSHCPPEANMPSPPTPAAVMPKPETAVAAPGTPAQPDSTEPAGTLAIVPFQKKLMANSSTHPKEYGQFRRFCERNEGSSMQVVAAFESVSQLSDVFVCSLYIIHVATVLLCADFVVAQIYSFLIPVSIHGLNKAI